MALLDARSFEATSSSEEQTARLGARLGALLPGQIAIALHGELGAGKTAFARGLGEGWGAEPPLRSPTFTLISKHRRQSDDTPLYHADLYRMEKPGDLDNTGLREILDDEAAVCLVEWPERAPALADVFALRISIRALSETKRQLLFAARDDVAWKTLLAFRKAAFGI
jgi:tRNA threonylcarbamoyladenosine biosynthesis protein TsaE